MTTVTHDRRVRLALFGAPKSVVIALSDIKLAHSVFAMPFAILAAFLAAPRQQSAGPIIWRIFGLQLILIALCMFLARTWAMLVNRLADHRMDTLNPRTAGRVIAAGRLSAARGWSIAFCFALLFVGAAAGFLLFGNPWPVLLAVPVLGWIALYSYTKRFTALCHLFLGSALALSPIAAAIAVRPEVIFSLSTIGIAIFFLAAFVMLWVAGFDIGYAFQDISFDREHGLRSIPAALGISGALWVGRGFHALGAAALFAAAVIAPTLGSVTYAACIMVAGLLMYEHIVLARRGVAGLPLAFFTLNGAVSLLLGVTASLDAALPL